ncbi:MAG TPA: NAD(+) diphosphatase [Microbacteriaceae bacterium]|nr:NAD(+) diphosphatase [Microbacteriaceae bacterium]
MSDTEVFHRDASTRFREDLWQQVDSSGDPHAVLVLHAGRVVQSSTGELLWERESAPEGERVYLGRLEMADGIRAIEARFIDSTELESRHPRSLVGELGVGLHEALLTAVALANWRGSHRYCPRCATALEPRQAGWMLACPQCHAQQWPRTDPAIIVRVEDDADRILLGSNIAWEPNRFSLLAGFVEPGESLERAVQREILEESGVRVSAPRYLASQGWPFPMSLMLGFSARAESTELTPDGEEIRELRWFTRAELSGPDIQLPRRGSVARALIEDWAGGPIEERHAGF